MTVSIEREVFASLAERSPSANRFASVLLSRGFDMSLPEKRSETPDQYLVVSFNGSPVFNLHEDHIYVRQTALADRVREIEGVEDKGERGVRANIRGGVAKLVAKELSS